MSHISPIFKRIIWSGLTLALCLSCALAQEKQTPTNAKPEVVRLKLSDGSLMTVDDAWETPQGVWYRQGGLSHLLSKARVKSIERGEQEADAESTAVVEVAPRQSNSGPAWIYLKGGARFEADEATESVAGVWYKRGPMSIFIDRVRIDRVEREDPDKVAAAGSKERGWSTGNAKLDGLIKLNGNKFGVDPYLVFLVMEQESHFNSRAVSPKGARGLMQLMPGTAARFGVRRPHDPAQNISGGTRYLRQLLDRFNNRVDLVLASYNAGEGAVIKFGHKVPPYRETRNYVKQISYRYKRAVARKKSPAPDEKTTSPGGR
jgi:Zn-finger nucleic acid-binding protein